MVGPVLHQELLLGGRRHRLHVFRWIYAGWLVLMVFGLFLQFMEEEWNVARVRLGTSFPVADHHASAPEVVGARFADQFVWQQTVLLFLVIPIFAAGAIIDEKRQGTLQYLLLTEMEPRHILLGKLLGRVALTWLWLLAGLPLFGLLAGFGGVEPVTLLLLALGLVMPVAAVAALSLLASVWCREARDAVVAVYVVLLFGWVGVTVIGGVLQHLDPLWVLEPAWGPPGSLELPEAFGRLGVASLIWGTIGGLALAIAALRLGPAYIRELENVRSDRPQWYAIERETVSEQPVWWREQHVEGLAPNPTFRRIPQWLGILGVAGLTTISSLGILYLSLPPSGSVVDVLEAILSLNIRRVGDLLAEASTGFLLQGLVVMLLASLVTGVRCAGSIVQERERQTFEALLLTPISAKQIIRGKLWGVMGASLWYLLAYAGPALSLSVLGGPVAFFYTLVWLGVTVLAMYFIGTAGLWCSVRASNSYRSLLMTLVVGYLSAAAIYVVTSPLIIIMALLLVLMLALFDWAIGTSLAPMLLRGFQAFGPPFWRIYSVASAIGLVIIFWLLAKLFQSRAQRWIADRDRTRHWYDEPIYRRSRRIAYPDSRR